MANPMTDIARDLLDERDRLRKQLAERDAEIERLKSHLPDCCIRVAAKAKEASDEVR